MAEDDIYGSKTKYRKFKTNLELQLVPPSERGYKRGGRGKYFCKNAENLEHFNTLFHHFEAKDISYIRRVRMLQSMQLICYLIRKQLGDELWSKVVYESLRGGVS